MHERLLCERNCYHIASFTEEFYIPASPCDRNLSTETSNLKTVNQMRSCNFCSIATAHILHEVREGR